MPKLAQLKKDAGLLVTAGGLVLFGCWLRVQQLGFPPQESWDEEHFVRNARRYLLGGFDLNDHPPLGKLLIALGMRLFGDNTFGWRIVPLCFGLLSVVLAYYLARDIFKCWRTGLIGSALLAADGFFISYSRTALLDGILAALLLMSALLLVRARRPWEILGACALVGLATSIKFTGVVMVVGVLVVTLLLRQVPRWTAAFLLATVVVYYVCFALGLSFLHLPLSPVAVAKATRGLLRHHLALTSMLHPATSYWYTWFVPVHPILLHYQQTGDTVRAMTTLGNPLVWWAGTGTLAVSVIKLGGWGLRVLEARRTGSALPELGGFWGEHRRGVGLLLLFWVLPLLPWVATSRDSYILHYLPCYGFALMLVAGLFGWLYKRRGTLGLAVLIAVAEVSVYYAPVWGALPVTFEGYEQRLFLQGWR